ncbi:MAG: hypothetical protein ACI9L9_001446 [Marivirga sp.]|jgi:hypothetical protein
MSDNNKSKSATDRLREETYYDQAALELSQGETKSGLWAKALSYSDGSEEKAKSLYIRYRFQSLQDQYEVSGILEEQETERAKEEDHQIEHKKENIKEEDPQIEHKEDNLSKEVTSKEITSGENNKDVDDAFSFNEARKVLEEKGFIISKSSNGWQVTDPAKGAKHKFSTQEELCDYVFGALPKRLASETKNNIKKSQHKAANTFSNIVSKVIETQEHSKTDKWKEPSPIGGGVNVSQKSTNGKTKTFSEELNIQWYHYVMLGIVILIGILKYTPDNTDKYLNGATKSQVCIALVKSYSSMTGDINRAVINESSIRINQVRASDRKRFYYDCKIKNNGIVWRMNAADGSMGQWRGSLNNPKYFYSVSNGKIRIE